MIAQCKSKQSKNYNREVLFNYFFSEGFAVLFGAAGFDVFVLGVTAGALLGAAAGAAFAGNVLGSATSDFGTFLFFAGA
jgi:hypothetical protein